MLRQQTASLTQTTRSFGGLLAFAAPYREFSDGGCGCRGAPATTGEDGLCRLLEPHRYGNLATRLPPERYPAARLRLAQGQGGYCFYTTFLN